MPSLYLESCKKEPTAYHKKRAAASGSTGAPGGSKARGVDAGLKLLLAPRPQLCFCCCLFLCFLCVFSRTDSHTQKEKEHESAATATATTSQVNNKSTERESGFYGKGNRDEVGETTPRSKCTLVMQSECPFNLLQGRREHYKGGVKGRG